MLVTTSTKSTPIGLTLCDRQSCQLQRTSTARTETSFSAFARQDLGSKITSTRHSDSCLHNLNLKCLEPVSTQDKPLSVCAMPMRSWVSSASDNTGAHSWILTYSRTPWNTGDQTAWSFSGTYSFGGCRSKGIRVLPLPWNVQVPVPT